MSISPSTIELRLLLEAIYQRYGYDFRDYAPDSLKRRIDNRIKKEHLRNLSALQHGILHNPHLFNRLLQDLSITTTTMFRNPSVYKSLATNVLPLFSLFKDVRIWLAGCATGEEIYSLSILLQESRLNEHSMIYATDINSLALEKARQGTYPIEKMKTFYDNYHAAGGKEPFDRYYVIKNNRIAFDPELRKNVVFAKHNLVTDSVFAEVELILCRNVLIYFNETLQSRVIKLFTDSLAPGGVLCLGLVDDIRYTEVASAYDSLDKYHKIFRKERSRTNSAPALAEH